MCLILLAWRTHPEFPLIVAANRDEFHARPAERVGFWKDCPAILAGRDLEANGTWMGVSRAGRFAAVTNYRGGRDASAVASRGALVTRFLANGAAPGAYAAEVSRNKTAYSGFNLVVAGHDELWWISNRDGEPRCLEPGIHGLGNLLLDTPELAEPKTSLAGAINPAPSIEPLFSVLAAAKIVAPDYGTRCATILIKGSDGTLRYAERPFDSEGNEGETVRFDMERHG